MDIKNKKKGEKININGFISFMSYIIIHVYMNMFNQ